MTAKERRRYLRARSKSVLRALYASRRRFGGLTLPKVFFDVTSELMLAGNRENVWCHFLHAMTVDCINKRRREGRPLRWQEKIAKGAAL